MVGGCRGGAGSKGSKDPSRTEGQTGAYSDAGLNLRIDSCRYVYNLNSSALGVDTYRVDSIINGQVVGSATFQLK
jgi:hypothetical protein